MGLAWTLAAGCCLPASTCAKVETETSRGRFTETAPIAAAY